MINNQFIAIPVFSVHMLTLFLEDEMLLPRHVNWSTNFRVLPHKMEMALSSYKHMESILTGSTQRPMSLAACSWLCHEDSAWADIYIYIVVVG